jgi:5-methyltetrahydrofolate--homocysteine methyltransferase
VIDRLQAALTRGPIVLDAAMGTRLIALGLDLRSDDPALWNLTDPEAVAENHRRDVEAGADALLTNTFGANRAWLARSGRSGETAAINRAAVVLARTAAGADRLVIGSIGPTGADTAGAVREQAETLAEAGVDALLFETHTADQAEAALGQVSGAIALPLLVSLVAWPESPGETARRLEGLGASAIGGNCQLGMGPALRMAVALRGVCALPLIVKPSAGRPEDPPATPASFAESVPALVRLGAVLVGGCCGTTEAHVAAIRSACYHLGARRDPSHGSAPSDRTSGVGKPP